MVNGKGSSEKAGLKIGCREKGSRKQVVSLFPFAGHKISKMGGKCVFREMRRKGQLLSRGECVEILRTCTSGVLSLMGDNGYPYGVPLSYVFAGDKIYFHCAKEGHKIDAIVSNKKASFCVIAMDEVLPEKYTTCYESVIVFGEIHIMTDTAEKMAAIDLLAARYSPEESEASRKEEIDKFWQHLCMLELSIEHMTGKQGLEMMKRKDR